MIKNISNQILGELLNEDKYDRFEDAAYKGLGASLLTPIGGAIFGRVVQNRVNSMYYACKSIGDPALKTQCRIKLLNYVINAQKQVLGKTDEKTRKKIIKSIQLYEKALNKLKQKNIARGTMKEAATGGALKGFFGAGPLFGMVAQSRIERAYYHCKQLPEQLRPKCQYNVLTAILQELKNARSKEPYNEKILEKIKEVEERLGELKKKMQIS